jgi:hypothetical protein
LDLHSNLLDVHGEYSVHFQEDREELRWLGSYQFQVFESGPEVISDQGSPSVEESLGVMCAEQEAAQVLDGS